MQYKLDDLIIDNSRKQVFRAGECLNISGLNYDFLLFLLTQQTEVIEFDALIKGIWAPAIVNHDTVTQRVLLLRNALGDKGRDPRYIRSVRGRGYQLVSEPVLLNKTQRAYASIHRGAVGMGIAAVALCCAWVIGSFSIDQRSPRVAKTELVTKLFERAEHYRRIGQHDNNDRAITLYRRVLQLRPRHNDARLGLSWAYTASMCRHNADPTWAQRAEDLATQVISSEPENFKAYRALGYAFDCRGQVQAAWQAYQQAIDLDPENDIKSQFALAYLLGETGHLAESLALNLTVSQTDPGQTFTLIQLGRVYALLGLHTEAESLFAQSFELYPDNIYSNVSYPQNLFDQGRFSESRDIVALARSRPMHPDLLVLAAELALLENDGNAARRELSAAVEMRPTSRYLNLLLKLHQPEEQSTTWATQMLSSLEDPTQSHDPSIQIKQALLHQFLGDEEKAIQALRAAVNMGYRNAAYLEVSPLFDSLRSAKGFEQVIEQIVIAVNQELDSIHDSGLLSRTVTQL